MGTGAALLLGALAASLSGCDGVDTIVAELGDRAERVTASEAGEDAPVWTYVDARGRQVFVGSENMVPSDRRAGARPLDLSHVSLHHELGRDWDAVVEREHVRLSREPYCTGAVAEASADIGTVAVDRYGHLLGIGVVALLLVVTAPLIARHVGWPRWTRVLVLVLPLLGLLALLTHVAVSSSEVLADARQTASLCDPARIDSSTEHGRAHRLDVVRQLVARIHAAHAERERLVTEQMEYRTERRR